jgi:hypothetical protein
LPSTQSQYYGTTPWNTNYCNVFLNMRTSRQWLEITDFFIYV